MAALQTQVDTIQAEIYSIEAGVQGSMLSPSDSDMCPGRIGWGDVQDVKGTALANRWESLREQSYAVSRKHSKLKYSA